MILKIDIRRNNMKWKPEFQKAVQQNLKVIYNLRAMAVDNSKGDLTEFDKTNLIKMLNSISETALNTIEIVDNGEEE